MDHSGWGDFLCHNKMTELVGDCSHEFCTYNVTNLFKSTIWIHKSRILRIEQQQ